MDDKKDVIPADEYCSAWNDKREKELFKQAEKEAQIVAETPRKNAMNYDKDYTGLIYESLDVLECVNDKLESVPIPYYIHKDIKRNIKTLLSIKNIDVNVICVEMKKW